MMVMKTFQNAKYSLSLSWIVLATITTLCSAVYDPNKKPPHPHIIVVTLRDMVFNKLIIIIISEIKLC